MLACGHLFDLLTKMAAIAALPVLASYLYLHVLSGSQLYCFSNASKYVWLTRLLHEDQLDEDVCIW